MGTLIWADTFETYTAGAAPPAPWTGISGAVTVSSAQSHSSPNSLASGGGGNPSNCYRPLGSSPSQWYADFWMWTSSSGSGGNTGQAVLLSSTTSTTFAPSINVNQTGNMVCGQYATTGWFTTTVTTAAWHHYLLEVTSGAAGTVKLTIDGTVIGTFSGDTRDGSNATFVANVIAVGSFIGPAPPAEFYVDDLSIYSGVPTVGGVAQAIAMVLA